jgi:hypothetical protein
LVDSGVNAEDADAESKDDIDSKRPDDLPAPSLPREGPESCFLYEWWCLFWDMFQAQRGKSDNRNAVQYIAHTQVRYPITTTTWSHFNDIGQQNSRSRQEHQQQMLRQIHQPNMSQFQMVRNQPNGMNMGSNDIARKAMHNNGRNL